MEKQYLLSGLPVRVEIAVGLVRIVNDRSLWRVVVEQPCSTTMALIGRIRIDYETTFNKELAITDDSFLVEIWGHLYFDYLLLKYSKVLKVILMFGLYNRFRQSCEVIDCGARGNDPNRWLWDKLVPFRKMLARQLRNARHSRYTEG